MSSIGYLGPEGTYSEKAALLYSAKGEAALTPCPTMESVGKMVSAGVLTHGVLPLENSCEGTVVRVLDLLAKNKGLSIIGEVIVPVRHHLLARPGTTIENINLVLSHPQALAQCSEFLSKYLPKAKLQEVVSTAGAARIISECSSGVAAIGNSQAGARYHLVRICENIQDMEENYTRFVVIGKEDPGEAQQAQEEYKISLLIHIHDRQGALYGILRQFALGGINLTKIESRPARTRLGEYIFFIDLDGHLGDPIIHQALREVEKLTMELRILGCYPKHQQKFAELD